MARVYPWFTVNKWKEIIQRESVKLLPLNSTVPTEIIQGNLCAAVCIASIELVGAPWSEEIFNLLTHFLKGKRKRKNTVDAPCSLVSMDGEFGLPPRWTLMARLIRYQVFIHPGIPSILLAHTHCFKAIFLWPVWEQCEICSNKKKSQGRAPYSCGLFENGDGPVKNLSRIGSIFLVSLVLGAACPGRNSLLR